MASKADIKQKEIRIQKPAQSLTAFQHKVASGMDERSELVKRFVIAGVAILVVIAGLVFWNLWRQHKIEQHETALAALIAEVQGNRSDTATPDEKEQRMRNALPRLEELARTAPGPCKAIANGIVSTWKVELGDDATPLPAPTDPWSRLRLANRHIALGQAAEAYDVISILHKDAKPDRAWSNLYWIALLQIRQLEGNRPQALKDYAEYRQIFKAQADLAAMDKMLSVI
ncbi:MAG: hypothetical protein LBQ86_00575 [Holophagales bacterium]|jgi:hypothetical protein|nr:hypothetical protein [Holophagales bacterium]